MALLLGFFTHIFIWVWKICKASHKYFILNSRLDICLKSHCDLADWVPKSNLFSWSPGNKSFTVSCEIRCVSGCKVGELAHNKRKCHPFFIYWREWFELLKNNCKIRTKPTCALAFTSCTVHRTCPSTLWLRAVQNIPCSWCSPQRCFL